MESTGIYWIPVFNVLEGEFDIILSNARQIKEDFEKLFGRKANKNRKLYNGMVKCYYYQYFGPRPPRGERA